MSPRGKYPRKPKQPNGRTLANDVIPRARVGRIIQRRIEELGLTRDLAGKVCHEAPSQMSRLMTGHFDEFSIDRLAKYATLLGMDVELRITTAKTLALPKGSVSIRTE